MVGLAVLYFTFHRGGAWSTRKSLWQPLKKVFERNYAETFFVAQPLICALFSNFYCHLNFKLFSKSSLTLSSLVFTINFLPTAIKVRVLKRVKQRISDHDDPWSVGPASYMYTVKVLKTFKGSFNENEIIQLKTSAHGSMCGVHLNVKRKYGKTKYILTGRRGNGQLEIMMCDWHEPWGKNTLEQIRKISNKC